MNIESLKERYLKLTKICSEADYADKKSVRKSNSAVNEMYKILESLSESKNESDIQKFAEMLNIDENRTNIWVTTQMLEKLNVDKKTEQKALRIIKNVANGNRTEAMGFQSWLSEYQIKN